MPTTQGLKERHQDEMFKRPDPERIFLGPKCEEYAEGRLWSEDRRDCEDCNEKSVEYVRLDIAVAGGYKTTPDE